MDRELVKRQIQKIISENPTIKNCIPKVHMLIIKNYYSEYEILHSLTPTLSDIASLM